MLYYIAYCFNIFFMVLEIFVLLYLIKNILPFGVFVKYIIDIMTATVLVPVQKIVKHSVLKCFKTDISPYILLIVLFYMGGVCSYIMEH